MSSDDRAQIERLLKIHRRNLATLETQAANYGGEINAPLNVVNQLDSTREQIATLEARVAALSGGSSTGIGVIGSPVHRWMYRTATWLGAMWRIAAARRSHLPPANPLSPLRRRRKRWRLNSPSALAAMAR